MKKIIMVTVATILMLLTSANAQSLQRFFEKYDDDSRFESVSVGKFLFSLALISNDMDANERELLSNLKKIRILTTNDVQNRDFTNNVMKDLDKVVNSGNYESLVEVRDKGERVNIYTKMSGDNYTDLLIAVKDAGEISLIWLNGKLPKKFVDQIQQDANNDELANLPFNIK